MNGEVLKLSDPCEFCAYYTYNEDTQEDECLINLDEDDVYRFYSGSNDTCPYFRMDDEYKIVERQN